MTAEKLTKDSPDRERAIEICKRIAEAWPDARIALDFRSPWQLLVAVILSAQTTDVGVNKVTPILFAKYPGPAQLAAADVDDVEAIIKPTGFYHNKAKSIMGASRMIVTEFGGKVPDTMEGLMRLPGVARKSANIVLTEAFGKAEGIAVDTHVKRLAGRLGFSENTDPDKIERDLTSLLPHEWWGSFNMRFIYLGRHVCTAKRPICGSCPVNDLCPSAFTIAGWRAEP